MHIVSKLTTTNYIHVPIERLQTEDFEKKYSLYALYIRFLANLTFRQEKKLMLVAL